MSRTTPETTVKRAVRKHLLEQGYFVFPLTAGMGSWPGVSDLVAVRGASVLWIECKSQTGRCSAKQDQFRRDIESHGGTYVVVRSVDDLAGLTGGCLALSSATDVEP